MKKTFVPLVQITQDDGIPPGAEAGIIEAVTRPCAAASGKDPSRSWMTITQLPGTHGVSAAHRCPNKTGGRPDERSSAPAVPPPSIACPSSEPRAGPRP
ncbi:hypothetical protein ABTY96_07825 [Streptomyces sp. NPDC096057]|uniref:hypothetical protein n=1 Tax=Streptomyces sp. NPDC096057 TaxID=3155543 RepID=UPI00332CD17A